jgi:hypothetical protein
MSVLQSATRRPRGMTYASATTVCVDDEPIQGAARGPVRADVRPLKSFYPPRPDKDSSSQVIRSLLLSTSLVMAYDPADEAIASLNTITSATPQPLPKVVGTVDEDDDSAEPRDWRGIYALEFPEEVIFTKRIDIRRSKLEEWLPRGIADGGRAQNEDE